MVLADARPKGDPSSPSVDLQPPFSLIFVICPLTNDGHISPLPAL